MVNKKFNVSPKPNVQSLRKIYGGKVKIRIHGNNQKERWSDSLNIPFDKVVKKITSLKKRDYS